MKLSKAVEIFSVARIAEGYSANTLAYYKFQRASQRWLQLPGRRKPETSFARNLFDKIAPLAGHGPACGVRAYGNPRGTLCGPSASPGQLRAVARPPI
ncbi:MAG: hypothetical protein ISR60_08450 [Anaerolineales bacterium]|nr:hypothetical protein [Anaerolineales bacterium]